MHNPKINDKITGVKHMREREKIKDRIEMERKKLDDIILGGDTEAIYAQSVKLDSLIVEYIEFAE